MKVDWKKFKRNIPTRVQISKKGFYEILWCEEFNDPHIMGETRFDRKQIVLKKGYSPKETCKTFFHELLHAISEEYNVGLTEKQVLAMEESLHYILKPNNLVKKGNK